MTPSPIHRVLSLIQKSGVKSLLMGGQACVFYGAAEFSRDIDLALDPAPDNLEALLGALQKLQAERIAVPPFHSGVLERGLAAHFRCHQPDVEGVRVDVMTRMRGVEPFARLWERRTTLATDSVPFELMSLPDLVQAKKTQRDKDWPMLRRLVEVHYFQHRDHPSSAQVEFWLRELRSPELLVELCRDARESRPQRDAVVAARASDLATVQRCLQEEEQREREADRAYWQPLMAELARFRRNTSPSGDPAQEFHHG